MKHMTLSLFCFWFWSPTLPAQTNPFPWPHEENGQTLKERFPPPTGFKRLAQNPQAIGTWLRTLPLLPKGHPVLLHNGQRKGNQSAQIAIIDMDVGTRDLQQCADAVMRLRAEFLWSQQKADQVSFNFTSGHPAAWKQWRLGMRPSIQGSKVNWRSRASANGSYKNFRRYLNTVFAYAGSASLVRELQAVHQRIQILPGDIFIQGGYPGHAVMVMDVAENADGERIFLLAQSYMPAQQIHILKRPNHASPWYPARQDGSLVTPEWRFDYHDLYRFKN